MLTSRVRLTWVIAVWLALAACSGGGPRLIGSYPKDTRPTPYASATATPPKVQNAHMELVVADPEAAAEQANHLVYDYGGYPVFTDSWHADGRKYVRVTLAVPVTQFDAVHQRVLSLGWLVQEDVVHYRVDPEFMVDAGSAFSILTVQFHTAAGFQWSVPWSGWNPAHTVEQAFGLFVYMLTILTEGVFWGFVAGGPFVLMGWGAVELLKKIMKH